MTTDAFNITSTNTKNAENGVYGVAPKRPDMLRFEIAS